MNLRMRRFLTGPIGLVVSLVATVLAIVVVGASVDTDLLAEAAASARSRPSAVAMALAAFGLAFILRTIAWRLVLPGLGFGQAWSAIHVTLGANHVLPLRLGEPLRVLSITRRAGVPVEVAASSTLSLRTIDVLTVVGLGMAVAPTAFVTLVGPFGWALLAVVAVVAITSWRWLARIATGQRIESLNDLTTGTTAAPVPARPGPAIRVPALRVLALSAAAWLAESVVVWQAARFVELEVSWTDAVLIATVAVAAQIAAIAPGGFGTYEAASVAAFAVLGYDTGPALVAALSAHGLKTAYSLGTGAIALLVPTPGLLGHLRLRNVEPGPAEPSRAGWSPSGPDGQPEAQRRPVVLFMPAYNEEASVAACVRRAPAEVLGHPVEVLVIDDGSTDATADRARDAGADVISLAENRGLGAAVRRGLEEGTRRHAGAVVFCDADGEYPPEELATLVAPILSDEADYVTGSRFLGRIDHMRPHRRFGNVVLTTLLSVVARTKITDGQTGYRAFSPAAAAEAEVIHDFNYAQVLTLDLLAKRFRMREVPISYHFRTEGESFIKLGQYLRNVVPAVYRELNTG